MTYKVVIAPEAIDDMQRHYDFLAYERKSIRNAEAQLSRIQKEILNLDLLPNGFRRYSKEPWHSRGLRYFPVDNYLVFYMVDEENHIVNVMRVIGGRMDLDQIWK